MPGPRHISAIIAPMCKRVALAEIHSHMVFRTRRWENTPSGWRDDTAAYKTPGPFWQDWMGCWTLFGEDCLQKLTGEKNNLG